MKRLLVLLCSLAPALAGAGCFQVENVCDDVRFKGRDGNLLLVCPVSPTQGRVVLTVKGLCRNNPPLRKFTRGDQIFLSCGYHSNPLLDPPRQPGECKSMRLK